MRSKKAGRVERLMAMAIVCLAGLSACGGSASDGSTTPAALPATPVTQIPAVSAPSTAMTISGSPVRSVTVGQPYVFTPELASTSGTATFAATNKPAWASFNVSTGSLTGTPTAGDVATYEGIVISATVGGATVSLPAFSIRVGQAGTNSGTVTLTWLPPTQNTDGTSVVGLGGYFIYFGTNPNSLSNRIRVGNPGVTAYTVTDLAPGKYYFAITTYTSSGIESAMSAVGSKTIV